MAARKRNAKRGFATSLTSIMMLVAVVSMGTFLVTGSNNIFLAKSSSASDTFTSSTNTIKENFVVEDTRFTSVTSGGSPPSGSTGDGRIVYSISTNTPQTKKETYSTSTWDPSEQATVAENTGIAFIITKAAPSGSKFMSLSARTTDSSISVKYFDGSTWALGFTQSIANWDATTTKITGFDIAYEQSSGKAIAVYRLSTTDFTHPYYKVWDGTSWLDRGSIGNAQAAANVEWIKLASKPNSNYIALAWSDSTGGLHAMIWNGSIWGNEFGPTSTGGITDLNSAKLLKFDLAYEQTGSNKLLIVASRNSASTQLRYLTFDGSSWASTFSTLGSSITVKQIGLAPNFANNNIFIGFCDSVLGMWGAKWDGTGITNAQSVGTTANCGEWLTTGANNFAISAIGSTGKAIILYDDVSTPTDRVDYALWNGSTWSLGNYVVVGLSTTRAFDLDSASGVSKVIATISNNAPALWGFTYDGTSWSTTNNGSPIRTGIPSSVRPFDLALELGSSGSPGTTTKKVGFAISNGGDISVTIKKIYLNDIQVWSGSTLISPKGFTAITFDFDWQAGLYKARIETTRGSAIVGTWNAS